METFQKIENLIPAKYRDLLLLVIVATPIVGRSYHALANGGGLMGVFRAILFGTNSPKANSNIQPPTSIETNTPQ